MHPFDHTLAIPADGQPGYGMPGYAPPGPPPPTYRVWRIIATVCGVLFSLILGLPAALTGSRYSKKASQLWASGDEQAAVSASRKARGWLIASTVLDVIGLIVSIMLIAQMFGSHPNFNNPSAVATSIKTQLQQRLSDKSGQYYAPGITVTSVVCTPSGTGTDHCVVTLSNGQTLATTAVVLGNGTGYRTR
jgi:Interferon-induced transmembrane protein